MAAADSGDEQHDRRDLEGRQVIGQEQADDHARAAEVGRDVGLLGRPVAAFMPMTTSTPTKIAPGRDDRGERLRRPALPRRVRALATYAVTERNMTITAPAYHEHLRGPRRTRRAAGRGDSRGRGSRSAQARIQDGFENEMAAAAEARKAATIQTSQTRALPAGEEERAHRVECVL